MHSNDYIRLFRRNSIQKIKNMFWQEISIFERALGKCPTHITSHKGIYGNFKLLNEVIKYCKDKNIPIRCPHTDLENSSFDDPNYGAEVTTRRANLLMTDYLICKIKGSDTKVIIDYFIEELKKVKAGQSAEILLYPAYFDKFLLENSSLNYERCRDLDISLNQNLRQNILDLKFKLISYNNL